MANSEDPDEMQHFAAFDQGLHCLLRLKQHSETELHVHKNLEYSTCDHGRHVRENSLKYKGINEKLLLVAYP